MKLHIKKIEAKYYSELILGNKNFELRKDDSDYEVGDLIQFIVPHTGSNAGILDVDNKWFYLAQEGNCTLSVKEIEPGYYLPIDNNLWKITYILRNVPEHGLEKDYCILALKRVVVEEYVEKTNLFPTVQLTSHLPGTHLSKDYSVNVPYNSYSFINKNFDDETK